MFSDEFDLELNDSFEDGSIFTFEEDNRTLKDVAPITNSSRFAADSSQGIQDIITNSKAKSTRKNTNWAMNTFRAWCVERNIKFELERIKFDELNELLSKFYVEVRREKGEEYSKSGLLGLRYGIERYFNEHVPSFQNIVMSKHPSFVKSNKVLNAILKTMKRENKLMVVHKAVISRTDLSKLESSGALSSQSPLKLLRAVWFYISLYWCRRGSEGQRQLTTSSFEIKDNGDGRRYAKMTHQEATKNHQGGEIEKENFEHEVKMYSVNSVFQGGEDPVGLLELYLSKVNPKCKAFFQTPRNDFNFGDEIWYENRPLGVNSLARMMKGISKAASLSQLYTNHSVRATSITLLSEAGMRNRHIMAISGHSNEQSLTSYNRRPSEEQLMECSDIISRSLNFRAPLSHVRNTQNRSLQNFPFSQCREEDYVQRDVQLQGMFNNCNIDSVNVVLEKFE